MTSRDRLHRSSSDRMIAGVSGGLAEYFDIDVTLVRLGWVVLCFVTFGMALLGYIVLAILMPKDGASDVEAGYTSADETDPPSEQTSPRRPIAPSRRRRGDVPGHDLDRHWRRGPGHQPGVGPSQLGCDLASGVHRNRSYSDASEAQKPLTAWTGVISQPRLRPRAHGTR